jgi:hypothetical protein
MSQESEFRVCRPRGPCVGGLTLGSSSIGWEIFGIVQILWAMSGAMRFITTAADG